jgi:Hypervirulence associated proteins TUDOR domain
VIKEFKAGDYVEWKAAGARAQGVILKKVVTPLKFKTQTVYASQKDPQYFIKPITTGIVVVKKASVLKPIDEKAALTAKRAAKVLKSGAKKPSIR